MTDSYIDKEKLKSHIETDNNQSFVLRHKTEKNNQIASKNKREIEVLDKFKAELEKLIAMEETEIEREKAR